MADQDPNQDRQNPNMEEPGDTGAADIVGKTGEQMPRQDHEGINPDDASLGTGDEIPEADEDAPADKQPSGVSH